MSAASPPVGFDVFVSYARSTARPAARALRDALAAQGHRVFLDEREIPPGSTFPEEIADGLLGARVIAVLADETYFARPWCVYEYQVALAPFRARAGQAAAPADELEHLAVALPVAGGVDAVTPHLPPPVARRSLLRADQTTELAAEISARLSVVTRTVARRLAGLDDEAVRALRHGGAIPSATALGEGGYLRALPGSLKDRFVGRAESLWRIFHALVTLDPGGAPRACLIQGGGGMGKTQLGAEYVWRYGARRYPGGVVWIDADVDGATLLGQLHGVLRAYDGDAPALSELGATDEVQAPALRERVAAAVAAVARERPVLWVIDNIPEPGRQATPLALEHWCPARAHVTVLATSRGGAVGSVDATIALGELPVAAAVEVLTQSPVARAWLPDAAWETIAQWVGCLPLALRGLHASLGGRFVQPGELVARAKGEEPAAAIDAEVEALRAEVPADSLRGIAEAFHVSHVALAAHPAARQAAYRLARLPAGPIAEEWLLALAPARVWGALGNRGWIQYADDTTAGEPRRLWQMHRLVASYLRGVSPDFAADLIALLEWLEALDAAGLATGALFHASAIFEAASACARAEPDRAGVLLERARRTGVALGGSRLADPDARPVRLVAARGAAALGYADELAATLGPALESGDPEVAETVVSMLDELPHTGRAAALVQTVLRSPHEKVRVSALTKGFGFVERALPLLESIVAEPDAATRATDADLFPLRVDSTLPDYAAARARLLELTGAAEAGHRQTAARILGALAYQASVYSAMFNASPEPDLLRRLEQMAVNDPADAVAREAGAALGLVDDPYGYRALLRALHGESDSTRSRRLIEALAGYLAAAEAPPRYQFLGLNLAASGPEPVPGSPRQRPTRMAKRPAKQPFRPGLHAPLVELMTHAENEEVRVAGLRVAVESLSGRQAIEDVLARLLAEKAYEPVIRLAATVGALAPDFLTAPVLRGQALEAIGRHDEAIVCLGEAIPQTPTPLPLRYERGRILSARGDHRTAIEDFNMILAGGEEVHVELYGMTLKQRAQARLSLGDRPGALDDVEAFIARSPADGWGHYAHAVCLYQLERFPEALAAAERACEIDASASNAQALRDRLRQELAPGTP